MAHDHLKDMSFEMEKTGSRSVRYSSRLSVTTYVFPISRSRIEAPPQNRDSTWAVSTVVKFDPERFYKGSQVKNKR